MQAIVSEMSCVFLLTCSALCRPALERCAPLAAPIGVLPHLQAIVDDISCVILHTCGLPPPERDCSVPRPLARAASCNDEANELYWKASRGAGGWHWCSPRMGLTRAFRWHVPAPARAGCAARQGCATPVL